ncbi:MAG: hypothetical protein KGS60_16440 [Verrucomicrobia bacterium]|nr:hypothetical protein [Verrucomicrobiota bacterium]
MIHPSQECLARFEGDCGENLAEFAFVARFQDKEERDVKLILGLPFTRAGHGDTIWIRAELEGLETTMGPIGANHGLQVIIFAMRYLLTRLDDLRDKHHCEYYWKDEEGDAEPIDFQQFFAITRLGGQS